MKVYQPFFILYQPYLNKIYGVNKINVKIRKAALNNTCNIMYAVNINISNTFICQ